MATNIDEEFVNTTLGSDTSDLVLRLDAVFQGTGAIERAMEWMRENRSPQDVFDRGQLEEWAKMNGYTPPPEEP
jgi:hypothetical protein